MGLGSEVMKAVDLQDARCAAKARGYGRAARERRAGCLGCHTGCGDGGGGGRAGRAVLGLDPGSGDVAVAAFAVGVELGVAG